MRRVSVKCRHSSAAWVLDHQGLHLPFGGCPAF
jgi:hypothetical protein